jgi:hypothetical protein
MKIPIADLIHLLHECSFGTLATHSVHTPGYPFATVLPFVPDEYHRPVFLMSRLAEHTKNVAADPRASLLVFRSENSAVLTSPRLTLVGDVQPFQPGDHLITRYRRYQPDAEQYLSLGDFDFYRLEPVSARMISGLGQMGWVDADAILAAAAFPAAEEAQLLTDLASGPVPRARVLGIDRFGLDIEIERRRERQRFSDAPIDTDQLASAVRRMLRDR